MNSLLTAKVPLVAVIATLAVAIAAVAGAYVVHEKDARIAHLDGQLQKAEAKVALLLPRAARAWQMPVEILRISAGGLIVTNQSNAPLPVTFRVIGGKAKSVVIPKPGAWLFHAPPGQIVEIVSGDFEPVLVRTVDKELNQSSEPMPSSVAPRAAARVAPLGRAAPL